ncbi:L-cysteine S-thiosulfotransferase subunit SoxA [Dissostichus eleginoides]|uniref:L-cysteine S-thiosulfotransferase subunit SoxA n=1 Tax=Dissostichus eleginoides TaxID=100907 RepID=A0AAD9F0G0_DISEL|nr:L-cysteine S-thiosulfotransferase subunit SoxA [Dissostichus eleginoides]
MTERVDSAIRRHPNALKRQLPYSCLHSVFARSHKTFLVRADEALLPTVGTPGKMGRSVGLLRPWCDTACPIRYTNTGTRLFPCSRTASICTHHYNEGPSVKAAALLISGILSGKIVASGQQQKAECCGNSRELWLLFDHTMGV